MLWKTWHKLNFVQVRNEYKYGQPQGRLAQIQNPPPCNPVSNSMPAPLPVLLPRSILLHPHLIASDVCLKNVVFLHLLFKDIVILKSRVTQCLYLHKKIQLTF
jgi:hypothetical protein